MKRIVLAAALGTALIAALPATAAVPVFKGTVGPGFTITIAKPPTKAGKVTFTVADKSNIHNWHLRGPGNKEVAAVKNGKAVKKVDTGVGPVGTSSYTVTLKAGKYTIICDPHAAAMKTSFTVK